MSNVEIIKHGGEKGSRRVCPECGSDKTEECYEPDTYKHRCKCKSCGCEWKDK